MTASSIPFFPFGGWACSRYKTDDLNVLSYFEKVENNSGEEWPLVWIPVLIEPSLCGLLFFVLVSVTRIMNHPVWCFALVVDHPAIRIGHRRLIVQTKIVTLPFSFPADRTYVILFLQKKIPMLLRFRPQYVATGLKYINCVGWQTHFVRAVCALLDILFISSFFICTMPDFNPIDAYRFRLVARYSVFNELPESHLRPAPAVALGNNVSIPTPKTLRK